MLFWKKRGEEALQRSGLPYTIVRPGGLQNAPRQGQGPGGIVMAGPGTFGLPPKRTPGSILRSQVPKLAHKVRHDSLVQSTCAFGDSTGAWKCRWLTSAWTRWS